MWPHSYVNEDLEVIGKCLEVHLCSGKLNIYGLTPFFNATLSMYVMSNFQLFKSLMPEINLNYMKYRVPVVQRMHRVSLKRPVS